MVRPEVRCYDFDGVVSEGKVYPQSKHDVIITGRTFQESKIVYDKMAELGISNAVYFNPMHLKDRGNHTEKARLYSSNHKCIIVTLLLANNVNVIEFFEDDAFQIENMKKHHPDLKINLIESSVEK